MSLVSLAFRLKISGRPNSTDPLASTFHDRTFSVKNMQHLQGGGLGAWMDFVLRNGETRAIEFLTKSDRVGEHHQRFETGVYQSLRLSGSYLVVDIKPWGRMPDILDVAEEERLNVASACFRDPHVQWGSRRLHHAVFLVSNDVSKGMLFTYNQTTDRAQVAQLSGHV